MIRPGPRAPAAGRHVTAPAEQVDADGRAAEPDVDDVRCLRPRDDACPAVGEIAELLRRQPEVSRDDGGPIGVVGQRHLEK